MNESEQAQTITQIRENHKFAMREKRNNREMTQAQADRGVLLEIVDSQAQKIAQLTEERDEQTATAYRLGSEAQQHISEARKIAEKMRDASERPGGGHTLLPWEKQ